MDDFFAATVVDSNTTVVAINPLTARVTANDRTNGAQFGWAVAATRDLAVIGAPHDTLNANSGSVYLFARSLDGSNTWTQVKKILPPDGRSGDAFGTAVAISADTIVVGSPLADSPLTDAGAAYVYGRNQNGSNLWGQVDKFLPATLNVSDVFGSAVAISGKTVVVGAYNGLDNGIRPGTAFMFRIKFNNAPQVLIPLADQTITPSSPLAYTVPTGAFADPDANEPLVLSLGAVPPVWLNFDPATGAFSGTPSVVGNYPVAVLATDSEGASATNQFVIHVMLVAPNNYSMALGFQTFGANQVTVVTLTGVAGAAYKLQRTPSLSGNIVWTDVATGTADAMFYRAVPQ